MWEIVAFVAGALVIGVSKTSVSGFGALAQMLFALAMPTKESTAAVLLLLIVGDVVAVLRYRRQANWALLRTLLPWVLPGIVLGALFMRVVDDLTLRRSIGGIVAVFVLMQIWGRVQARRAARTPGGIRARVRSRRADHLAAAGYGTAAGFTTMTANAAGPVMTLYLLAAGVGKKEFVGTNAWYFLIVNISKVPFAAALGLFPASTLQLDLALLPVVLVGTLVGVAITDRISRATFEWLALAASVIAAVVLLLR